MKMEQMGQQIREILAAYAHYVQMEILWTRLWAKLEVDGRPRSDCGQTREDGEN
jgi:hypothetical protein